MSNYKEAELPFPWIPILIVFCTLVLTVFVGRWLFQYATYLWNERNHYHHKKKKKKKSKSKSRGRSRKRKSSHDSSSSDESSSSSE